MNFPEILGFQAPFVQIVFRSALVYVAMVVGVRVSGRRQLGQMTPFDLVLILLISNAVQNAMVGPDTSVFGGLVAAGTLLVLNWITNRVTDRNVGLRRALEGDPILLVNDGVFIESHLQLANVTREMVEQAMREHGFDKLSMVHIAVLEVDGTISIVPRENDNTVQTHRSVRPHHHARAARPGGGS